MSIEKNSKKKINSKKNEMKNSLFNCNKNKDKKKYINFDSTKNSIKNNNNKNNGKVNLIGSNSLSLSSNKIIAKNEKDKKNKDKKDKDKNEEEIIDKIVALIPKPERAKYFSDDELNLLEYKYAIKIDFRSFDEFYSSLLRQTHFIIFIFFVRNDYNVFLTKLSLFLISLGLYMFMNTLFFVDDTLHQIYDDEGEYNFIYQLPQMLYSTFSSQIAAFLFEKLSLTQDDILGVKEQKTIKEMKKELIKSIKCIKKKLIIFFILGIFFLFVFWYYLSAFCAVYKNTQVILLQNSLISYITGMIY